jgi:hypothetical protein
MGRTVYINGQPYIVPDRVTGGELRDIGGIHPSRQLIRLDGEGNELISSQRSIAVREGDQFMDLPQAEFGA